MEALAPRRFWVGAIILISFVFPLNFTLSEDNVWNREAYARLSGHTDPSKEKFGWWKGKAFGVKPNQKNLELCGFEGFSVPRLLRNNAERKPLDLNRLSRTVKRRNNILSPSCFANITALSVSPNGIVLASFGNPHNTISKSLFKEAL